MTTKTLTDEDKWNTLVTEFESLEKEISKREGMNASEAKTFFNHLTLIYDRSVSCRGQMEKNGNWHQCYLDSKAVRETQQKIVVLQADLAKIFHAHLRTQSESKRTTDLAVISLYRRKRHLFDLIVELEARGDAYNSPIEAKIINQHIAKLYELFIVNQNEICSYLNGPDLDKHLELFSTHERRIIELQIRLQLFIASSSYFSQSATDHNIDNVLDQFRPNQAGQPNETLAPLSVHAWIRCQRSLVELIEHLHDEINITVPMNRTDAKVKYDNLFELHRRYMRNHERVIHMNIDDDVLEEQLAIYRRIRLKVMRLQTYLTQNILGSFQ